MSHRRPALAVAVLTAGFALTACGSGDDPVEPPAAQTSAASSASSSSPAADVEYATIDIPEEFGGGQVPVPLGVEPLVRDEVNGSFLFQLEDISEEEGFAFYSDALPAAGYTVTLEIELAISAEDEDKQIGIAPGAGGRGVQVYVEPLS